jgi:hypothetical protein
MHIKGEKIMLPTDLGAQSNKSYKIVTYILHNNLHRVAVFSLYSGHQVATNNIMSYRSNNINTNKSKPSLHPQRNIMSQKIKEHTTNFRGKRALIETIDYLRYISL